MARNQGQWVTYGPGSTPLCPAPAPPALKGKQHCHKKLFFLGAGLMVHVRVDADPQATKRSESRMSVLCNCGTWIEVLIGSSRRRVDARPAGRSPGRRSTDIDLKAAG